MLSELASGFPTTKGVSETVTSFFQEGQAPKLSSHKLGWRTEYESKDHCGRWATELSFTLAWNINRWSFTPFVVSSKYPALLCTTPTSNYLKLPEEHKLTLACVCVCVSMHVLSHSWYSLESEYFGYLKVPTNELAYVFVFFAHVLLAIF